MATLIPGSLTAVRHAKVHAEGLCYGQHDVDVAVSHQEASAQVLTALAGATPSQAAPHPPPTVVWTSDLGRCRGLAERIAAHFDVHLEVNPALREIAYGEWEGRPWDVLQREDAVRFSHWMTHFRTEAPPGGERIADLEARVGAWWRALTPDAHHLLIAHSGVVRVLRVLGEGLSWDDALRGRVPHLTPVALRLPRSGPA